MTALSHGDNPQLLRDSIAAESVDLIYLDPPFNSKATYNVRSRGQSRHLAEWALISAYSQKADLLASPEIDLLCGVKRTERPPFNQDRTPWPSLETL